MGIYFVHRFYGVKIASSGGLLFCKRGLIKNWKGQKNGF